MLLAVLFRNGVSILPGWKAEGKESLVQVSQTLAAVTGF